MDKMCGILYSMFQDESVLKKYGRKVGILAANGKRNSGISIKF